MFLELLNTAAVPTQVRVLYMVPSLRELMDLGTTFLPLAAIYMAKNRCARIAC